ncbi:MAG: tetratricopeptide repeat protein [Candidatus Moranbacteria bacterium]|nr:tetratricopeptide repeat protein [Candidatus Moranbacteria bacterium]
MSLYNIVFPFFILLAIGIIIYVLTRHLPEIAKKETAPVKEEKKRWWQVFWGKGENLLRLIRVLILKIDNKLNDSIKKIRGKKELIGKSLREYRKQDKKGETSAFELGQDDNHPDGSFVPKIKPSEKGIPSISPNNVKNQAGPKKPIKIKHEKVRNLFQKITYPKRNKAVEEIIKKTFTPTEIKVETQQYWKKKEDMLIQSIVREPKNINLYIQLGRLYSNQHNWNDARNAFLEVLKLDKTNIKAKEELKRIEKYINS